MTKKNKEKQNPAESEGDIGGFEDFGIDIQEAVKQRLAHKNKKTVQLNELLADTKFTKSEIRTMYRGFKQVSQSIRLNQCEHTGAKIHFLSKNSLEFDARKI